MPAEENPAYWRGDPILSGSVPAPDGRPRAVELFCGLGGLSQGFRQAGFQMLLGADIHRPSIASHQVNYPDCAHLLGDLREVSASTMRSIIAPGEVDVLLAGVPCQGFSRSNRKRSDADERNLLFVEFVRLAKALKPRAVVIENVAGIASAGNGAFVSAICREIEDSLSLDVKVLRLNAADFGVPQNRERYFFVGIPREFRWVAPSPSHGEALGRLPLTVRDAISDLPELAAGQEAWEYVMTPQTPYQKKLRGKMSELVNHRAPSHPPETIARIASTRPGEPMYPRFKQRIRLDWDRPSPTQVSGGIRAQFQFGHPGQARGLTVRERARIQSFPDHIRVEGGLVQGRVQTGNAVPPLLAQAIAQSLTGIGS